MQSGTLFSLGQYVFIMVLSWLATLIICYALYLLWTLKKQRNFECAPSLLGNGEFGVKPIRP
jgi:lipoprotein signal peptidase